MPKSVEIASQTATEVKKLLHDPDRHRIVLMLYKMNMCPHCIALEPTWRDVETRLSRDPAILVTKVEYGNMHLLPRGLHDVRGFPSIVVLKNGQLKGEYNGDRSSDSIVSFARSHRPAPPVAPKKPATPATRSKKAAAAAPKAT